MAADTGVKVIPGMSRFKEAFTGIWHGAAGGLGIGLGMALLGAPVGSLAGGFLGAAIIGGQDGRTIAVISGVNATKTLLLGSAELDGTKG